MILLDSYRLAKIKEAAKVRLEYEKTSNCYQSIQLVCEEVNSVSVHCYYDNHNHNKTGERWAHSTALTADWTDKFAISTFRCLWFCFSTADIEWFESFLSLIEGIEDFTCFLSFFFLDFCFFFFFDFSSGTSGSDSLSLSLDLKRHATQLEASFMEDKSKFYKTFHLLTK